MAMVVLATVPTPAAAQDAPATVAVPAAAQEALDAGRYLAAAAQLEQAAGVCAARFGDSGAAAAPCLAVLTAWIDALLSVEQSAKAEAVARRRLAIARARFGEVHGETASGYSDLAVALKQLGRRREAEVYTRRDLALSLQIHGRISEDTYISCSNLASNLDAQGRHDEAVPLRREALAITQALAGGSDRVTAATAAAWSNLGFTLQNTGAYRDAVVAYRQGLAQRRAVLPPHHPLIVLTLSNLATNLQALGDFTEARALLEEALDHDLALGGPATVRQAYTFHALARNSLAEGRAEAALAQDRRALAIFDALDGRRTGLSSGALSGMAHALAALGRRVEADAQYRAVLGIELALQPPDPVRVANARLSVAESLLALGLPRDAAREARLALLAPDTGPVRRADAHIVLAKAEHALGRMEAAADGARAALAALDTVGLADGDARIEALTLLGRVELGASATATQGRARIDAAAALVVARAARLRWFDIVAHRYLADRAAVFGLAVAARWNGAGADGTTCDTACGYAFVAAQRGSNLAAATALVRRRDIPIGLAELSDEHDRLVAERERIDAVQASAVFDPDAANRRAARRAAIDDRLAAIDRAAAAFAGAPVRPEPLTPEQAQARLHPRQALLLVLPVQDATFVWTVTPTQATWRRIASRPRAGPARRWTDGGVDRAWGQGVLQDLAPLLSGVDTLFVVSSGAAAQVAMAALPVDGDLLLGERVGLIALPGVSQMNDSAVPRRAGGFFGIGAPVNTLGAGDVPLSPLRHAAAELATVGALFAGRATVRTGPAAREATLADDPALATASLVLMSTHGIERSIDALDEQGLVLEPGGGADGFLTAGEIAQWRLSADLVVLAACDSAAPDATLSGDPHSGLARAFLQAGARAVLVSQRPVDDAATSRLIVALFRALARDATLPVSQALRAAMVEVRRADGERFADPRAWGSFVLVATAP
ncbi:CHAT domain-containing tetratricopeptide repeat protein [Sphingomonas sp. VNH70]|uniref:CHAT domain-containing tetratricopeptide repeat protein n=1 Tax=Sphingomonas silueang TaxID=3156617 RepID=UPI0032B37D8E